MSRRYVTLPAVGKRVSLRAYAQAVRLARANPGVEFKHGLTTWWPTTGAEIMSQYRGGLHERISAGISYATRGTDS